MKMTLEATVAFNTILALREITATTQTVTTRSQAKIFRSLNDEDLAAVAYNLKQVDILCGVKTEAANG